LDTHTHSIGLFLLNRSFIMRFSFLSAAVLAFASSVAAQDFFDSITSPTRDQMLVAGTPFDITWAPLKVDGTVKITLLEGNTNVTLADGPVIASESQLLSACPP
jgi:hypothetical protein